MRNLLPAFFALCAVACGCSSSTTDGSGGDGAGGGEQPSTTSSPSTTTGEGGEGQGGATDDATSSATTSSGEGGSTSELVLGPEQCPTDEPANGEGVEIGQRLADYELRRCDGTAVTLRDYCGATALWVFAAHGWCPVCRAVSENQEALVAEYASQGLIALNIVVETGTGDPATQDYCALWRDKNGLEDVVTLFDPTGDILTIWPGGSSSLSAFVDRDRIITGKLSHTSEESALRDGIETALASGQ